ncbi:MAG: sn-glycerol-3-phosphate ABC transporter ATP-binding protein UgpC [Bacilli bacterium]|nr:sn-glycerol-3-phosphate ABC transporter ATP-binding protein UgpC [Bacilli bacterium]
MPEIKFENVNKIYENGYHAVHDLNLTIKDGEFIILVGPSGCGKSTTLRMLAGLESISGGELKIANKVVNALKPKERGIAMVFQSYALYPTMTVYDNLAFSLRLAGVDEDTISKNVKAISNVLEIEKYLPRKPKALSGGQQQRVALGRALIRKAKVFLMDEPLSNLDALQRVNMRTEIRVIHNITGATTVYVTHDQIEAMTMADRIVVMKDGYIQQIGTPKELYFHPTNLFVAGFIGDPQMNFIKGHVEDGVFISSKDKTMIKLPGFDKALLDRVATHKEVIMGFRPESCALGKTEQKNFLNLSMIVEVSEMLGDTLNIYGKLGENDLVFRTNPFTKHTVNKPLDFYVPYDRILFFDSTSENIVE